MSLPKVVFTHIKSNAMKLGIICKKVEEVFLAGEKILIAVPSAEAAAYVDQLLWRMPEESFIPHAIVNGEAVEEHVAIVIQPAENFNRAQVLLNLMPSVSAIASQFSSVYEFYDETDSNKTQLSLQRQREYYHSGYPCETEAV